MKTTIAILALLFSTLAFADHFPTSVEREWLTTCWQTHLREPSPVNWLVIDVTCEQALTGKEIQRGGIWGTAFAHNLQPMTLIIGGKDYNPDRLGGALELTYAKRVKNVRVRLVGFPMLRAGLSVSTTFEGEQSDIPAEVFYPIGVRCDHYESRTAEPPVSCTVWEAIIPQLAGSQKTLWIESLDGEASILKVSSTNKEPTYYPVAADTGGGDDGQVCVWNDEDGKFDCEDA